MHAHAPENAAHTLTLLIIVFVVFIGVAGSKIPVVVLELQARELHQGSELQLRRRQIVAAQGADQHEVPAQHGHRLSVEAGQLEAAAASNTEHEHIPNMTDG